jgi:hypothetical protein
MILCFRLAATLINLRSFSKGEGNENITLGYLNHIHYWPAGGHWRI